MFEELQREKDMRQETESTVRAMVAELEGFKARVAELNALIETKNIEVETMKDLLADAEEERGMVADQLKVAEEEKEYHIQLSERTLREFKVAVEQERERAERELARADKNEFMLINTKMHLAESQERSDNFQWVAQRYHEIIEKLDKKKLIVFDRKTGRRDNDD